MLLNEHDLKDHILRDILELEGVQEKSIFKKKEATNMRILMDSIKYHLVHLIAIQNTAKKMYYALNKLYENEKPYQNLSVKDQLRHVKFTKDDSISSYFMKTTQNKDQLVVVDESVPNRDLVLTSMGGLPSEWKAFVKGICGRGQLPSFG